MDQFFNIYAPLASLGLVFCLYAAAKIKKQQQGRRYKVRPINRERRQLGNYQYYKKMKSWDLPQFFKYTRMTRPVFEKLHCKIKSKIRKQIRSDGISTEERLVITLQFLSQGTSMQVLAWTFNLGLTTVHKIIHETCTAIWECLKVDYLKSPSTNEEWLDISNNFYQQWNFPNCLGAIDGKHVAIQAPSKSGSLFYNYKKHFSIVLLAACDSKYKFTMVDIGAYGSASDGGIFKNSSFGHRFEKGELNVPPPKNLPGSVTKMPYFLVGDEAFPLKEYIMRPYPGKNLNKAQKVFNYRLSRARQTIENTFGILVARWRVLKTTINAKVENIDNIVKAVVVLHNYCQIEMAIPGENNIYCPEGYVDSDSCLNGGWRDEQEPLQSVGRLGSNISKKQLYSLRDQLASYFISPAGEVPWQETVISKGLKLV